VVSAPNERLTPVKIAEGEDSMFGSKNTPYRSLSGLLLGAVLFNVCLIIFSGGPLPVTGWMKLIGPPVAVAATAAEPQQATPAYRAGRQAGRADAERDLPRNPRNNRWTTRQDSRDYAQGYNRGYSDALDSRDNERQFGRDDGRVLGDVRASINIGRDNIIRWQAPGTVRVYVQVDNEPMKLFAEGPSGSQQAPWIESGHSYTFIVRDLNGNGIAQDRLDLRRFRR